MSRGSIRKRFLSVDTANVADVLDDLGHRDQGLTSAIGPVTGDRVAGWVYTISGEMAAYEGSGDEKKMLACQGIGPDEVSVWAGDGRGVCYFGELIALGMKERGSVGALVDGGLRDTRALREHAFPVFAKYTSSVQSIGRWRVVDWQVPIAIAGATAETVRISPGDFLLADDDGAIAIPARLVERVLERAEEMTRREQSIRAELRDGLSLSAALEKFGHV